METEGTLEVESELTRLARVAFSGGLAGTANAWLCYVGIPIPVDPHVGFKWHVIPAGAAHGALLATFAFGAATLVRAWPLPKRLAAALPLGWLTGYASWLPLNRSLDPSWNASWSTTLLWPFAQPDPWMQALWVPFVYFGLVAVLYYLWLTIRGWKAGPLWASVASSCAAGTLGSLWFWIIFGRWYFSVIHGVLWGVLVGVGTGLNRAESTVA
jgi:hypothetical protein